jgi:hypothetical protein
MSVRNSAQQDGVVRRAGRWSTAAAVVITEAAQHYVGPGSTLETVVDHANTGAVWGLGFQLVAMASTALYRALPSDGSFTVSWRVNGRGDSEVPAKKDPQPTPGVPEARAKESSPENEKHGV